MIALIGMMLAIYAAAAGVVVALVAVGFAVRGIVRHFSRRAQRAQSRARLGLVDDEPPQEREQPAAAFVFRSALDKQPGAGDVRRN